MCSATFLPNIVDSELNMEFTHDCDEEDVCLVTVRDALLVRGDCKPPECLLLMLHFACVPVRLSVRSMRSFSLCESCLRMQL